ncbi:MAG: division/cell wall cluster transcriptional repressor MraZ [Bacteroidia bacterium]|nr:division/cell wall cluster transcriptional repressor MraZ [Bacteroidia bacterium]MCZ2277865.1 division/cell wall cluster transcriptional repressor MraZ [Bacteroidia bacterium]
MNSPLILHGVHEATADAKGRFMLPGSFRKQLENVLDQGFIIKRSIFSKALELFPKSTWNAMADDLRHLNRYNREHMDYMRLFTSGMQGVEVDSVGRIQIPKELILYAGIKKDITCAAITDIIEIWDTRSYNKFIKEKSDSFEDMTERLLGKKVFLKDDE